MIKKLIPVLLVLLIFVSISAVSAAETKFNTSSISTSANNVQKYVETNKKLPSTVKVSNTTISTPQYLYLVAKDIQNVNKGTTTSISLVSASKPPSPSESLSGSGTLTKAQYLALATTISTFITKNKRPPNYATLPNGKTMRYENLVYTFSKVMAYYKTNNRLPNTVTIKKWSTITSSSSGISPGPPVTFTDTSKTTTKTLGSNSLGSVQKIGPFGTGSKKVAVIIGVHPQEGITHVGMMNALKTLASQIKNVQIWVFKVNVKEKNDYSKSRMDGQLLAQKYVVPNIGTSYKLAVDIHGNRGLYKTYDFVFAPSKRTTSVNYANKLIKKTTYLKYYTVADGTSPKYVTIPIANKGIPAVIFELYLNVNNYNTVMYNKCLQLVKAINTITYV